MHEIVGWEHRAEGVRGRPAEKQLLEHLSSDPHFTLIPSKADARPR
jgi:hypothetical protein